MASEGGRALTGNFHAGLRKLEEDEAMLDVLRTRLKAGEDSSVVENFDSQEFMEKLHKKHLG